MAFKIRKKGTPSLPPPNEVKAHIDKLLDIDLQNEEVDSLKNKLEIFFRGYSIASPVLSVGQILYRGVRWRDKPSNLRQVSYPPAEKITTCQRANRPGHPMFYSSIAREAAIFELRPQAGDHIAVSKWQINKKIIVNNVGYIRDVFDELRSIRPVPNWGHRDHFPMAESNKLVTNFFGTQFSKIVQSGREYEYKLSIAIAEKHYIGDIWTGTSKSLNKSSLRFGGLIYPTITMRANADNIALLPDVADQHLTPLSVEWLRVDSEGPEFTYQVTILDFSNSFLGSGEIEWKGRLPQWRLSGGQEVTVAVENGHWVVRNGNGEIIEPS